MFNYLFPIFAFGLVITGIVFLGLQQAAVLAEQLNQQNNKSETDSFTLEHATLTRGIVTDEPEPVVPNHL